MAGANSRMTMLTRVQHGSLSLHGKDSSKDVETVLLSEFEIYKSDMKWIGLKEIVTHVEKIPRQLLDAG